MKVGQLGWLHVEGLSGRPWGRAGVARLTLRDKDGVWLEARGYPPAGARPRFSDARCTSPISGSARITVLRRFTPLPTSPPTPSLVSIRLDRISARIETLPAFSVNRGLFVAIGSVRVNRAGAPTGDAHLVSLLRPGDRLDASFAFGRRGRFALAATAREAQGGALAGALGLPPAPGLRARRRRQRARSRGLLSNCSPAREPTGRAGERALDGGGRLGRRQHRSGRLDAAGALRQR